LAPDNSEIFIIWHFRRVKPKIGSFTDHNFWYTYSFHDLSLVIWMLCC